MNSPLRPLVWLVVALAACSSGALAQEWTRFRGPNGTGLSDAKTIPTTWTEKDYNWRVELPGGGHSSPVLWGDRIFLTSADEANAQRYALCLSATDGRLLWKRTYSSSVHAKHKFNSFASATPTVDELHAYFVWSTPEEYTLLAVDHDGKEVWSRNLGPFISQHSCGTSPIVFEDLVVLGNEQDGDMEAKDGGNKAGGKSFLIAVDRKTGETRWQIPRTSDVVAYSTPCVHKNNGGRTELIFNSKPHGVCGVDPKTGKINWEVTGLLDKRSCSSSLLANGLFIATCGSGGGGNYLVAIHPGGTGKPNAGQLAYRIDKGAPYVPTPIAKGDLLFLWSDGGIATGVRASTGEVLWQSRVGGNYFGSPICVEDRLYNISTDGEVVVLGAADKYVPLGRNPLGELSHSTPSVANGTLYLRTFSHLISVGGKKG